jgi:hypothetical protein
MYNALSLNHLVSWCLDKFGKKEKYIFERNTSNNLYFDLPASPTRQRLDYQANKKDASGSCRMPEGLLD